MFWADRIAEEIKKRFGNEKSILIRDEKTISGRVHVGSMRGVAIHGAVAEALASAGSTVRFRYELNDFDVFDGVPDNVDKKQFEQYVGMLVKDVPSPDRSAENFAHYYGNEFRAVIEQSGFTPEFYWGSEPYMSGAMDAVIRESLESALDIRRIYKEVSGSQKDDDWLPLSVVCPTCRKLGTTTATDFDGTTVLVRCNANAKMAPGCGFEGRVSPFGGTSKITWKVEWAAKWKVHGIMTEGGGKDHSTKGGARDVANHIAREVFKYEPPFDIPYEFFLVGGQKMSSSKGRGSSAKEIADLVPPKIFRLALLGKDINQAINFDPAGDTIPVLYDLYDKLSENYWAGTKDDYARLFELIHPTSPEVASQKSSAAPRLFARQLPASSALPRFSQVAFIVQMPHMDIYKEFPEAEKVELAERAEYAKKWIEGYAPEKFVFKLQETMPEAAKSLSEVQKKALRTLVQYIESSPTMPSGEDLHHKLHEMKESGPISPAELFSAIYLAFLGKPNGPKAGWFLSVLDRDFLLKRLEEASSE